MGGQASTALAIAVVPHASLGIMEETLFQLLAGALSTLGPAGCTLVGGHSCEGSELSLGKTPAAHVLRIHPWCQLRLCPGRWNLARASLASAARSCSVCRELHGRLLLAASCWGHAVKAWSWPAPNPAFSCLLYEQVSKLLNLSRRWWQPLPALSQPYLVVSPCFLRDALSADCMLMGVPFL